MNARTIVSILCSTILCSVALALAGGVCGAQATTGGKNALVALHWQPLNEPGSGGWMTGLQVSPHDPKRILLGGDMLGIGLSEDGGETWQATFGLKSWEVGDLTWHPTDPKIVWVGTMSGPYLSLDGGRHWQEKRKGMPPPGGFGYTVPIEKVLFDPNDATHLIAIGGSSRGWEGPGHPAWGVLWESRDAGENWTRLTTLTPQGSSAASDARGINVNAAAFAARSSKILYAGMRGAGVLVSMDGGKTWTPRNNGLPQKNVERVIAHPTESNTVFVALNPDKPQGAQVCLPGGIYKSVDAGKTWIGLNNGLSQKADRESVYTAGYKGFAVAPSNPDVMYADDNAWNTGVLYGTRDGGKSWQPLVTRQNIGNDNNAPNRQKVFHAETAFFAGVAQTTISVDPHDANRVYSCGAEYILASRDGGKTWTDGTAYHPQGATGWRGRGFSGLVGIGFKFHPDDPKRSVLLAMDAGKIWVSRDGLQTWTMKVTDPSPWFGGDDVTFAGKNVYATFGQFNQFYGIGRSPDDGDTFTALSGKAHGLPDIGSNNQPSGIYARPDAPNQVWAVIGRQLYHSADSGETWKTLVVGTELGWIAGDPNHPERFYVSGSRNVYRTEDGEHFTAIGGPHQAGHLTVDSLGRLYAAAAEGERGGLWRWDGKTWRRLWDDRWVFNVAVDPTDPNRIAFATNQNPYSEISQATGVWISADAGKTWTQQNAGLAMLRGQAIAFNPHDPEQLVFGADGRGFWITRWPNSLIPQGGKSYTHTAEDTRFAAVLRTQAIAIALKNGDMTEGKDVPANWQRNWEGRGHIAVARDTAVFKTGPASLRVSSDRGDALGQAAQLLDGTEGTQFTLKGWVRSAGKVKINVAIQAFTANWSPISFQQAQYTQNDTDWTAFAKRITLPPGTAHFAVVLLLDGDGKAWLDDVTFADVKLPEDRP